MILFFCIIKGELYMKKKQLCTLGLGLCILGFAQSSCEAKDYYAQNVLYQRAEKQALKGNFKSAIANCNKYIIHNGETPEIYYLMGSIKTLQEDFESADANFGKAIELSQKQPIEKQEYNDLLSQYQLHFLKGAINIKQKEYENAEAQADLLINGEDKFFSNAGYILKTEIDYQKGDTEEFVRDLKHTMMIEPLLAKQLLGEVYNPALEVLKEGYKALIAKNYHAAIDIMDVLIENNPTFYLAYALRGYAKTEVKDYYCATRDLDDAIALNPELSLAYYFRAHLNEKINNPKNAKKDYALADTKQDISYKDLSAAFGHSVSSPEGNSSSDNFILYKKMVDILFQY